MADTRFVVGDGSFSIYNEAEYQLLLIGDTIYRGRGFEPLYPKDAVELVKLMAEFLGYKLDKEDVCMTSPGNW